MKCLVFAYSEIGATAFELLRRQGETIVGLVTHEDRPGEVRWWRSVREMADRAGVPVRTPENPNTPEMLEWARDLQPDILFSFYYRLMLKKPWLELAPRGAYNLHGSLLPRFRGRAPINWAIVEGEHETGLTLHEMVERPDAGRIVDQAAVAISENDTARDVFEKVVPLTRVILERSVPLLSSGQASARAQDESQATYFGARTPADGCIDWNWSAARIHNLVRGVTRPYPGAFTFLDGEKIFIWKGHVSESPSSVSARSGEVIGPTERGVGIQTGAGCYVVEECEAEGQRSGSAPALLAAKSILGEQRTKERL